MCVCVACFHMCLPFLNCKIKTNSFVALGCSFFASCVAVLLCCLVALAVSFVFGSSLGGALCADAFSFA